MSNWLFLFGLAAVFAALVVAAAEASLYQEAARATMTLGGGVFTIPLAAFVRADKTALFTGVADDAAL